VVTIPLAPRTAGEIDLGIGERCEKPIFLAPRRGAAKIDITYVKIGPE
jgi:hypothetical protein